MADSLCGPSNALQSFQKHTTVDRTLQQDRLVGRPSPSQGFRSSPGPNAGLLDPEFEAFQAGQLRLEPQHLQHGHPQFSNPPTPFRSQLSQSSTPQNLQQAGPSGWASDFQRLQISSPIPQPQFQTPAQQRQDTGGWHQDFAQNFQGGEERGMMQSGLMRGQAFSNQFSPMSGGMGMGMGMGMQQYGGRVIGQTQQAQQQQSVEAFDDEAFARAFEAASQAEMENQGDAAAAAFSREEKRLEGESQHEQGLSQAQTSERGQEILLEESAERFMSSDQPQIPNQAPIGADLIEDYKIHPAADDSDQMARTAAHLLDTVRDNTSEKFTNSEFFQLMRQFRDKELTVAGDKIVGTNGQVSEGEDEIKVKAMIYLLYRLQKLALFQAREIACNSGEQARKMIYTLLQVDALRQQVNVRDLSVLPLRNILLEVLDAPDLQTLPETRDLLKYILCEHKNTLGQVRSKEFRESMRIRRTKKDIKALYPSSILSSDKPTQLAHNGAINVDAPLEHLVYQFIASSLESGGLDFRCLDLILGYEFESDLNSPHDKNNVHMQRAREIMGPSVAACLDLCQRFWYSEISVERFFNLVHTHQRFGSGSEEVSSAIEEIEEGVWKGMIEKGREKYKDWKEGDKMSEELYQNHLMILEAHSKLRLMAARREQGEIPRASGN